jgi:hypothetical protein
LKPAAARQGNVSFAGKEDARQAVCLFAGEAARQAVCLFAGDGNDLPGYWRKAAKYAPVFTQADTRQEGLAVLFFWLKTGNNETVCDKRDRFF